VLEARDGLEALELLARCSTKIHLVLSDVIMPRMGGTELAERLRNARPDTKVLLMTGYSEYSNELRDAASLAHVLQKPFSLPSLIAKVREIMSENSMEPAGTLKSA